MEQVVVAKQLGPVEAGVEITSDETFRIFSSSVVVKRPDGTVLAVFVKRAVTDPALIAAGRALLKYKASSNSRGMAAGIDPERKRKYGVSNHGFSISKVVHSSVVGYLEHTGFYPCRQSALYKKHLEHVNSSTVPLIEHISGLVRDFAPEHWARQEDFMQRITPHMRLGQSVFTTITVNVDFRTLTHRDKGDFASGLGNLMVFQTGDFEGGELLLPEYRVGFALQEGDFLLFDVHELHCNNPIRGAGRVSLVCYARERIQRFCSGVRPEDL